MKIVEAAVSLYERPNINDIRECHLDHLDHLEQAALLHDTPASWPTMRVVSVSVGGSRLFWACKLLSYIVLALILSCPHFIYDKRNP